MSKDSSETGAGRLVADRAEEDKVSLWVEVIAIWATGNLESFGHDLKFGKGVRKAVDFFEYHVEVESWMLLGCVHFYLTKRFESFGALRF